MPPLAARGSARGPRAVAIVPARLASRRLARKMLLSATGRCLFEHTVENVAASGIFERVVLATDAEEIAGRARAAGIEVVLTRPDHESGTARVAEAAALCDAGESDVLVNVQGDEPELDRQDLARLVAAFGEAAVECATLASPLAEGDHARPQVVKVVCDARGDALYFSRAPIPYRAAPEGGPAYAREDAGPWQAQARRHIGVYAFRPAALAQFVLLPRGALEALENLEQLRWLEAGRRMRVVAARHVPLGIDTPEDYDAFVQRFRRACGGRADP
jgi:3-deoxy-manno-octulosonate cytidylyltransferase (CMP-KDO synthetase)